MQEQQPIIQQITKQGVLPLYYHQDKDVSLSLLKALYEAGIRTVEYTNRGEAALENFRAMKKLCETEMKDMYLGVGTIKSADMAQAFIDAGCDYIISPGLAESVVKVADNNNMLWIPGCMTPTEIINAENLGAKLVKLFPGNIIGAAFMAAIKDLFPNLLFMPTGGVDTTKESIGAWFNAGVCAVGMGSKLISTSVMESRDFDKLIVDTELVMTMVNDCRK